MNDPAIGRFLAAVDRVIARLDQEVSRAEAIHALRAREGRTVGAQRRARLAAMLDSAQPLLARWGDAMALHRDPAIVREAARFERHRAGA
jgi:hypothetical protein